MAANGPYWFVLHHGQRRYRLGRPGCRRCCSRRPGSRRTPDCHRHHRRWLVPVLGTGGLDGGPAQATYRVRGLPQRRILDPQVVRQLEEAPGVPGLDLPGLDIVSVAKGFGLRSVQANTAEEIRDQFKLAVAADGPTVIVVDTQPQDATLG